MDLETPLSALKGVGPVRARQLAEAGYRQVGDLLLRLPSGYEDRRVLQPIEQVDQEGEVLIQARLRGLRSIRGRRRGLTLVRGTAEDSTGRIKAVWFNRPYLVRQIDPERELLVHGRVRRTGGSWELVNADISPVEEGAMGSVLPVYRNIGEVGSKVVRGLIRQILDALPDPLPLVDPLPVELQEQHDLAPLAEAVRVLHDPPMGASPGAQGERRQRHRDRMAYGELLELQLILAAARARRLAQGKGHRYRVDDELRNAARRILPFPLTGAQKRVLREIVEDLRSPAPMGRLLQGDVGSGKTIVAALALLIAAESGLQGAFMAPTEVLAEQQHAALSRWLGDRHRVDLLTSSATGAEETRTGLAEGSLRLVVGTHALIQSRTRFRRLGLVVVDEQHRFGVEQRRALSRKGEAPDLLVMTATPIPRSLTLTAWGDLDRSILDELPPGRLPIRTELCPRQRREQVYRRLQQALQGGERAFVVLPHIEGAEAHSVASLEHDGEAIRRWLEPWSVEMVHGRLDPAERERALGAFAEGRSRVLLATTVIEVGIDVPEATWMIIESAERFGLAQLHQLRGRVGRGDRPSRCIALHGRLTPQARYRLQAFRGTQDGFRLAEADLELRGPGDLLGVRQAGEPLLEVADLVRDAAWLEKARSDAELWYPRLHEPAQLELLRAVGRRRDRWRGVLTAPIERLRRGDRT